MFLRFDLPGSLGAYAVFMGYWSMRGFVGISYYIFIRATAGCGVMDFYILLEGSLKLGRSDSERKKDPPDPSVPSDEVTKCMHIYFDPSSPTPC